MIDMNIMNKVTLITDARDGIGSLQILLVVAICGGLECGFGVIRSR